MRGKKRSVGAAADTSTYATVSFRIKTANTAYVAVAIKQGYVPYASIRFHVLTKNPRVRNEHRSGGAQHHYHQQVAAGSGAAASPPGGTRAGEGPSRRERRLVAAAAAAVAGQEAVSRGQGRERLGMSLGSHEASAAFGGIGVDSADGLRTGVGERRGRARVRRRRPARDGAPPSRLRGRCTRRARPAGVQPAVIDSGRPHSAQRRRIRFVSRSVSARRRRSGAHRLPQLRRASVRGRELVRPSALVDLRSRRAARGSGPSVARAPTTSLGKRDTKRRRRSRRARARARAGGVRGGATRRCSRAPRRRRAARWPGRAAAGPRLGSRTRGEVSARRRAPRCGTPTAWS